MTFTETNDTNAIVIVPNRRESVHRRSSVTTRSLIATPITSRSSRRAIRWFDRGPWSWLHVELTLATVRFNAQQCSRGGAAQTLTVAANIEENVDVTSRTERDRRAAVGREAFPRDSERPSK